MKSFDSLIGPAARAAMRDDRRIREAISRIVPAQALHHVTFCRLAGRQLRVTLDSAAWVPRLRFTERPLLAELARDGLDARTVSWHVAPVKNPGPREPSGRRANAGSAQAARAVLSAAESIDDEALAGQMRRMARRLTGRAAPEETLPAAAGPAGTAAGAAPGGRATPDDERRRGADEARRRALEAARGEGPPTD